MPRRYIMTAFGHDRTGILAEVSKVLYENGCNLEDSEMTRLADEIALIFLFSSGREDIEETLSREFHRLEVEKGLPTYFRRVKNKPEIEERKGTKHDLHIEGVDQVGIIYAISIFLAEKDINIVHLRSERNLSPLSGTAIYKINLEITRPETISFEEMKKGLRKVGDQLHVDIQID